MNDEIMVSVICLAYNHEPYIKQCLEGFVSQKTNFKFEVLIHDDASTDKTADIIREYEAKYPEMIKPIYQTENQYSQGISPTKTYLMPAAKGKYLAWCEGDDYWCDENKLQMQFDVMELHSDCALCVHCVEDVLDNGQKTGIFHPNFILENGMYTPTQYYQMVTKRKTPLLIFHTSSYFMKKESIYISEDEEKAAVINQFLTGDVKLFLSSMLCGNIFFVNKTMSCYRTNVPGSWTSTVNNIQEKRIEHQKKMIRAFIEYDVYTNHQYTEYFYYIIESRLFPICIAEGNYKELLKKEHRKYFKTLSTKEKIFLILKARIPKLMKLLNK